MLVVLCEPGKLAKITEIDESLDALQAVVGGPIEPIYPFSDPVVLICNEEGKFNGHVPNRALLMSDSSDDSIAADEVYDIVFGPFFICGLGEEDFESLTEEQAEKYEKRFHYIEDYIFSENGTTIIKSEE